MPRLSRKLRVCKWVGTLSCALIAAAFVLSDHWTLTYFRRPERPALQTSQDMETQIELFEGVMFVCLRPSPPLCVSPYSRWSLARIWPNHWQGLRQYPLPRIIHEVDQVRLRSSQPCDRYGAFVPFWLPFLIVLLPTLWLWHRDRRKPPDVHRDFCRGCDYDLTGNTSGVCPECGAACEPAIDVSLPSSR